MERLPGAAYEAIQQAIRKQEQEIQRANLCIAERLDRMLRGVSSIRGYQGKFLSQRDGLEKFPYIFLGKAANREAAHEGTMEKYPHIFPFPAYGIEPHTGTGEQVLHVTRYGVLPDIVIGKDKNEYVIVDAYFFGGGEAIRYDAIYHDENLADPGAHPHLDFTPTPYERYVQLTENDYGRINSLLDDIEQAQSRNSEDKHP